MPDAPPVTKTLVPQDLHDRPYLKDWLDKPFTPELASEVFKKLDGAETLVGRKIGIPGEKATPEEIEKFYSALRPAKAEEYEIKAGEGADQEFLTEFRQAGHKAGLSKKQLADLVAGLTPGFQARAKARAEELAKLDQEFDGLVKEAVGADHEKKVKRVQAALKQYAPEPVKKFIENLDNKSLVLVVGAVNAILEKYGAEDDLNVEGGSSGSGSWSKEELLAEANKLFQSDAWKNFQHPDHDKTKKRIDEIFAHPAVVK